ncbi:MAG: transcriptional repressor [Actinomycetota bacterium]|nr:transcriptional repressor [Actinomycetota bacterium]
MRTPAELAALYRSQGRKVTPQRQCIFRVLHGDETHPSAEVVYESARREMETISLKTVYQTLHELAELGEIAVLDVGTGSIRFDPNVDTVHHHLVCRSCGRVRDLVADFSGLELPDGAGHGFEVGAPEVVFRGRCPACIADADGDQRRKQHQQVNFDPQISTNHQRRGALCPS